MSDMSMSEIENVKLQIPPPTNISELWAMNIIKLLIIVLDKCISDATYLIIVYISLVHGITVGNNVHYYKLCPPS